MLPSTEKAVVPDIIINYESEGFTAANGLTVINGARLFWTHRGFLSASIYIKVLKCEFQYIAKVTLLLSLVCPSLSELECCVVFLWKGLFISHILLVFWYIVSLLLMVSFIFPFFYINILILLMRIVQLLRYQ